jgi:hypothetical protein
MIENQKLVKISDVVENQIPEFILEDNPNFAEFLKSYYQSQEFQGGSVDLAENLSIYKNFSSFNSTNLISSTTLTQDIDFFDDVIGVESTKGWPERYGLLKINNEIITYTGITTNSFTGCIRGFSGIESLSNQDNPELLVFSTTESDSHSDGDVVSNLSNLFLIEFFKKQKSLYLPYFENVDFDENINPQNFLSKSKAFYQSKGTDEAYKILFKVLYNEKVTVVKPREFCFTSSDDKWIVTETFICDLISGDPFKLEGQTLYQDLDPYNSIVQPANGSIYAVDSFLLKGKIYYKIRLFSGYSNNLNPKGSISGKFLPTFKTYCVETVIPGSNSIFVDSTVGFPQSGVLSINEVEYSYQDKTNNQFLGVSTKNSTSSLIDQEILRKSVIYATNLVYSYEDGDVTKVVKLRVNNVLSTIKAENSLYASEGDPIKIDNIGYTDNNTFIKSLKFNLPITIYGGKAVETITSGIRLASKEAFALSNGLCITNYDHNLSNGDIVDLYVKNFGEYELYLSNLQVTTTLSKEFSIQQINDPSILGKEILFRRKLKKTKAVPFTKLFNQINNKYTSNIQDAYADLSFNYLTSNGLPDYEVSPYIKEFEFSASELNDNTLIGVHNFYEGEAVKVVGYAVSGNWTNKVGFNTGDTYYVKRIGPSLIRLSETRDTIGVTSTSLIELDVNNTISGKLENIVLTSSSLYGNEFSTTKTFKKIPKIPKFQKDKVETQPGPVGIFANGIEIQNYKSFDKIYYGQIDTVDVLSGGEGYSLINPPQFDIFYTATDQDTQTFIIPEMKGELKALRIMNSGYDYEDEPVVTITGGNRKDVPTVVKMKFIDKLIQFNATTSATVVRTVTNDFRFDSIHPFIDGEAVSYETRGTSPIGIGSAVEEGTLLDQGIYYISQVGAATSFRLAPTRDDALRGTNLINIRTAGGGIQVFKSLQKVQVIDEVSFIGIQSGFEYKKLSFGPEHINIFDNIFYFDNHGFGDGQEVEITAEGTYLDGAVPEKIYYVNKIDNNSFTLYQDVEKKNILNILSTDPLTTYFVQYPAIRVKVNGRIRTTKSAVTGYGATIVPVIQGTVTGAKVQRGLSKPALQLLGSKNVVNLQKRPTLIVLEGSDAEFEPIVDKTGKIIEVAVKNAGQNYFNDFEFIVEGQGYGAQLVAQISNGEIYNNQVSYGQIIDVKVINGGVGYATSDTTVRIQNTGSGLKVQANLTTWTLNEVSKLGLSNLSNGCLFGSRYSKFGNTFGTFFLDQNLINSFGINPNKHSPIIGWAYDGCPIYGPYAYANADGTGIITRMRSGYIRNKISPPALLECIEDYQFTNAGDLDENNGRFAVTPEYPKGVYAYYCTIDANNVPVFPYVIGNSYNYIPNNDNFDLDFNQSLNFNELGIIKYTKPYRVEDKQNYYEFFELNTNTIKPDAIVSSIKPGKITSIKVIDGGLGYEKGDNIEFEDESGGGIGAFGEVESVAGVGVNVLSSGITTFTNVTFVSNADGFVGVATTAHNFASQTYVNISGISTTDFSGIEGFVKINVEKRSTNLIESLDSQSVTGLVTSIRVKDSIINYRVDEELKIGSEVLKIIGLDRINGRLNVLRQSGSPGYSIGSTVTENSSRFTFRSPINFKNPAVNLNESYYFKSSRSVSVGVSTAAGAGNNLTIYPYGIGVSQTKFVENGGIYLPFNNFRDGERVVYTTDSSTIVTDAGDLDSLPELYVVKINRDVIGLVEDKRNVKNRDYLLKYTSAGTGDLHKFQTQRSDVVTGSVTQVNVNVSTASSHGLSVGNNIRVNVISGVTTTYSVGFSTSTRVLIDNQINPKVRVYANETVVFDLTSPTIAGKDFNIYSDEFFRNPYFGNDENGVEVFKTPTTLTLKVSEYTPPLLYYNLKNLTTNDAIYPDVSVNGNNEIKVETSLYSIESSIISAGTTSFSYNLPVFPERSQYTSALSDLNYSILDSGIKGPIDSVKLIYGGSSYEKIPSVKSITTQSGKGADLYPITSTIGRIQSLKILNTESVYPSDKTLSPVSNAFVALRTKNSYQVGSVEILDRGKKYQLPPSILLYNKVTNQIDATFKASIVSDTNIIGRVVITNPSTNLKSTDDFIAPIGNSNGIRILDATSSGSAPYEIELRLETPISGFSTANPLPISVGDLIYVENISSTGGSGFNSSDYDYDPFVVTYVNPNFSSPDAAIIRYELPKFPGTFSSSTFNAGVVKYNELAKFNPILVKTKYANNELLSPYEVEILNNEINEPISDVVKVHNSSSIKSGDIIRGKSTHATSEVFSVEKFSASLTLDSSVSEQIGWKLSRGNLSTILQKLPDNDYYQNFSYSLKSKKSLSDWKSIVSDISHVSGYKGFGDLSIESDLPVGIAKTLTVTSDSASALNITLVSEQDINTVSNFDLVVEEDIDESDGIYSEYLKFGTKKLSDFLLSEKNRVLSVDDVASLFDTDTSPFVEVPIDTVDTTNNIVLKYYFFIAGTVSFFGAFEKPQVFDMLLTRTGDVINLTSYGYYYDFYNAAGSPQPPLGEMKAEVSDTDINEISLNFVPRNIFNSYKVTAVRDTVNSAPGLTSTSYGYVDVIEQTVGYAATAGITTYTLYSYPLSDLQSGTGVVGISSAQNRIETAFEFSFVKNIDNIIDINYYADSQTKQLGTIGVTTSSGAVQFTYTPVLGIGVTVFTNLQIINKNARSPYVVSNNLSVLTSENYNYTGGSPIGLTTVPDIYAASKYIIQVEKTVGVTTQRALFQLNSVHFQDYNNLVGYGFVGVSSFVEQFTFDNVYNPGLGKYTLTVTPSQSATYNFKVVKKNILTPNI